MESPHESRAARETEGGEWAGGEEWRERERERERDLRGGAAGVDAREDGCDRVFNSVVGFVSKITAGLSFYLSTAWGLIRSGDVSVLHRKGRGGARRLGLLPS
jgi:hypothetical protein